MRYGKALVMTVVLGLAAVAALAHGAPGRGACGAGMMDRRGAAHWQHAGPRMAPGFGARPFDQRMAPGAGRRERFGRRWQSLTPEQRAQLRAHREQFQQRWQQATPAERAQFRARREQFRQHWQQMTPAQREQAVNRWQAMRERWGQMTPEQRDAARQHWQEHPRR